MIPRIVRRRVSHYATCALALVIWCSLVGLLLYLVIP